jgi:hypothetical protein
MKVVEDIVRHSGETRRVVIKNSTITDAFLCTRFCDRKLRSVVEVPTFVPWLLCKSRVQKLKNQPFTNGFFMV